MSALLDLLLTPEQMMASLAACPKLYQAHEGRRRSFRSQRDATAYDAGYINYPRMLATHGPAATGWHDRDQEAVDHREWQIEVGMVEAA